MFCGDGRALPLGLLELREFKAAHRVRAHPPADGAHRRNRIEPMAVRSEVVQARRGELTDLRVEQGGKGGRGAAEEQLA